jgi:hypothetical protein
MEILEFFIVKALTSIFLKSKIPLFVSIDFAIIKFFNVFLENKEFLMWLLDFEWRMIKGVFKVLLFISFLFFIYWVIYKNLPNYLFKTYEEYTTKEFENFQKIRQKRWINFFIMFFLLNPLVLVGQIFIISPFSHLAYWLLSLFFVEREYFLKDGYYDDYLFINIPIIYEKDLKMVAYLVKLEDSFYIKIFSYVIMIIFSLILIKFYFDWFVLFDNFVYKNMRKTSTFNELLNEYKYWKEKILKIVILFFPYSKLIFVYIKKIVDHQELRILDDDEYEEFYKKNLEFYYKKQFFITNLMLIIENYFSVLFNRPQKNLF